MNEIKNTYKRITFFSSYIFIGLMLSIIVLILSYTSYSVEYVDYEEWFLFNMDQIYATISIITIDLVLHLVSTILIFVEYFKLKKYLNNVTEHNQLSAIYGNDLNLFLATCIFSIFYLFIFLIGFASSTSDFLNNAYIDYDSMLTLIFNKILSPLCSIPYVVLFIVIFAKGVNRLNDIQKFILNSKNKDKSGCKGTKKHEKKY